ncbi:type I-E CRISPR-associated protein Cse2/CasB [Actinoalloteichus caeruleus]|uniref:type I-E CRISPR-associated protein Cse2/CasB n=1 Tax=Actinoalloteichus cyanogriseus TaxID=2893586 RepID=UPI0009DF6865
MTGQQLDVEGMRGLVSERVAVLQDGYLKGRSSAMLEIARIRRAFGHSPGVDLSILKCTFTPELVSGWYSDRPSPQEIAAHHAITLYALHQHVRGKPMHAPGWGVGRAVRELYPGSELGPRGVVARKFGMLMNDPDLEVLVHHLGGLVRLLRGRAVPLDYGRLADQLLRWQIYEDGRNRILRVWGREYHRTWSSD